VVKIRLKRFGSPKRPYYRIVAMDARKPRDGQTLDELGYYRPVEADQFKIDAAKVKQWLDHGAQMSDTVRDLIRKNKISVS
jgi:small subunit ribosomal protein S16